VHRFFKKERHDESEQEVEGLLEVCIYTYTTIQLYTILHAYARYYTVSVRLLMAERCRSKRARCCVVVDMLKCVTCST
jgi:hypothetical protein